MNIKWHIAFVQNIWQTNGDEETNGRIHLGYIIRYFLVFGRPRKKDLKMRRGQGRSGLCKTIVRKSDNNP